MPRPYKGVRVRAHTRIPPAEHAEAQRLADKAQITLSDWIAGAIREKITRDNVSPRKKAAG